MHLYYDSINDAFTNICRGFHTGTFSCLASGGMDRVRGFKTNHKPPISRRESRNGDTLTVNEPVTITYLNPLKRVLFHPIRNANPFFHVIEALWMLCGQNKVQPLTHFVQRMASYSDDELTSGDIPYRGRVTSVQDFTTGYMWGAYGYRWRNWFRHDQIEQAIEVLRRDPLGRRAVISMWEPADLHRVDTLPTCKDVPCNLVIMFSARKSTEIERYHPGQKPSLRRTEELAVSPNGTGMIYKGVSSIQDEDTLRSLNLLDMTVINRSNDTLWGALGANYVHFSFLQEYIANATGMAVGSYHQISNNLHIYDEKPNSRDKHLWSGQWEPADLCKDVGEQYSDDYRHYPLFKCPWNDPDNTNTYRHDFDNNCYSLFYADMVIYPNEFNAQHLSPFFKDVVMPMLIAWNYHKSRQYVEALINAARIVPTDWRIACEQWLRRAAARYTKASDGGVHAAS